MSRFVGTKSSPALIALGLVVAMLLASDLSHAQSITRRDIPKGEVTGLEMAVEGSIKATAGGRLRWFVTVYEIVKGRDLRPAAGVDLQALASFHRSEAVGKARTDARGRASIEIDVPDTLKFDFDLVVQARSPKGIKRDFTVGVTLTERFRTELFVERRQLPPGAAFRAWGRVINLATMKPATAHAVDLQTHAGSKLVGQRHALKTNAQGLFERMLVAPTEPGSFTVSATGDGATRVTQGLIASVSTPSPLIVRAQPEVLVTKPGTTIWVDVSVRTPDGRPIQKAILSGLSIPEAKPGKTRKPRPVLTNAQGRARVPWLVRSKRELAEAVGTISALREGIGTGSGTAVVRVTSASVLVSWAVEGGTLVPGLPNRVVVRALHPDGRPWTNLPLAMSGGRLQAANVETDADGAAVFEAQVVGSDRDAPTNCQGPTLAAATLQLGIHTRSLCLPVDPDATLRLRSPTRVRSGDSFALGLLASKAVARLPVAITVLGRASDDRWIPLVQQVVNASQSSTQITLPPEARGAILIRARPLLGATLQPVRGGTAMLWAQAAEDPEVKVRPSATGEIQIESAGTGNTSQSGFAIALPTEAGQALWEQLHQQRGGRPSAGAGEAEWLGFLAAQTPTDQAVSSVLRNGSAFALAMPEDSVAAGLLRDPWRTRSRFVRGRLGRLMFAVEKHVALSLPDELHNVAVRGPRGWRFNTEILTYLANDMGIEAVAGLDGNPLSIADLQKLDPEFVYDNVARRLTRERLMRVLVGLRQFVKSEQLDYQWARRGDPRTWLRALLTWDDPEGAFSIEASQLYDGWGKPFAIRKAKRGRARFTFLEPIVGYELVSAGPDGRFGSADDVFDPFARVLGQNSIYGQAVGEGALLARLQGVELGRATIAALSEVFELAIPVWEASQGQAMSQSWSRPDLLQRQPRALEAHAVGDILRSSSAFAALASARSQLRVELSADPRRYLVLAGVYTSDGMFAMDKKSLQAGAPLLIDASMPPRLRPGEPLRVPLHIIGLDRPQDLQLEASSSGVVAVEVLGEKKISLKAGESKTVYLKVHASRVGRGTIGIRFRSPEGVLLREFEHKLPVMWQGSLRAQHSGALATKTAMLALAMPAKVKPVRSRLVVAAPRDLLRDPGFAIAAARYPEVLAWAHTMRGETLPKALLAALSRRPAQNRSMPILVAASAAVAWSATREAPEIESARNRALAGLRTMSAPTALRERSALLVALASAASLVGDDGSEDPVTALVAQLRSDGWHAPRTEKSRPTVMARLAAGLLLADPEDMPGRQLFSLAHAELVSGDHGGKTLPGDKGSPLDAWIGTLALAIAARQLGEEEILAELVDSIAPRFYLGMQGDVEPAFWLLAASAYGVFGIENASSGTATIAGKTQRLRFRGGVATIALPRKSSEIVLKTSSPVLARVEARYVRPLGKASASALSAKIRGEIGYSGDIAGLEVAVHNASSVGIERPIVEVLLPSAALLSKAGRESMAANSGVDFVEEPDGAGLLRIHLSELGSKQDRQISLPIQWIGEGVVGGLSVAVYDANAPWQISSTVGRSIELAPAPEETWK